MVNVLNRSFEVRRQVDWGVLRLVRARLFFPPPSAGARELPLLSCLSPFISIIQALLWSVLPLLPRLPLLGLEGTEAEILTTVIVSLRSPVVGTFLR